jgi:hypothetical protein
MISASTTADRLAFWIGWQQKDENLKIEEHSDFLSI